MKTTSPVNSILYQIRNRISILESEQSGLRVQVLHLPYGSKEYIFNQKEAARVHGELCGLAYAEGALEVHSNLETRPPQGLFEIQDEGINDEVPFQP